MSRIQELKAEHPFWGYRRVWAYLHYAEGISVNKKRILRLMSEHGLLVKPNMRLKATRTLRPKPKPTAPNQWWGTDMTKVMVDGFGWVYVVIVIDWYTKKFVGWHIGPQAKTRDWLKALDMAVNRQFPGGVRGHELSLMSDNGCQPTSVAFIKACSNLGIRQAFTSYNNPKGNADTERSIRTAKEECFWLREWKSPTELALTGSRWFEEFNKSYLHSALGYKTPERAEREFFNNGHFTQLAVA